MNEKLAQLNADARRLFAKLCEAELESSGRVFSMSRGAPELVAEFGDDLANTIEWLNSKGLSEWMTFDGFTISDRGKTIAADPEEELDQLLPVPAEWSAAPTPAHPDPKKGEYDLNATARRLLAFLHKVHVQAAGNPPRVRPGELTFGEDPLKVCVLDRDGYTRAGRWLVSKGFARWFGTGGGMRITNHGADVTADADRLDDALPVGPKKPAAPYFAPEAVSAIADVRKLVPGIVADDALREIVERDLGELEATLTHGLHKSTAVLAGSLAEAVLLDLCDRNRAVAQTYMKQRDTFPEKASLDKLIEIARSRGLIEELTQTMASAVREYRDLIHPDRERRSQPKVDSATGGALVSLLRLIVRDVNAAVNDGRVQQWETS